MKKTVISLSLLIVAVACSKTQQPVAATVAAKPAAQSAAPIPQGQGMLSGKVLETMNAGGYTYLRLDTGSGEEWAAIPQAQIAKGDSVSLQVEMTMDQFQSQSLNRTFDKIIFATLPSAAASAAPTSAARPQAPEEPIQVAAAPGGKTVAQLWADRKALAGKEVVVRGQVVKYHASIMGKNWIHIQDGSGSKEAGDNDLTVTTDATAGVGDVITISGTVAADKDFGAGYEYAVIVEQAKVSKN